MLSAIQVRQASRRRRSPYSDKQHYQEYILQRIEGYKNSIGRDELLRLGDEAATELQATSEGQFVLTEVLMLESVDRLIMKRLSLRPYRRWRQQFLKLRAAQRTPTHWGLDPHCPAHGHSSSNRTGGLGVGGGQRRRADHLPAGGARCSGHLPGRRVGIAWNGWSREWRRRLSPVCSRAT